MPDASSTDSSSGRASARAEDIAMASTRSGPAHDGAGSTQSKLTPSDLSDHLFQTHARSREQPALVVGQIIGKWEVLRLIGRGGMGSVYLARDTSLGRKVALKLVSGSAFLHEAQTIAKLSHTHIVVLHSCHPYGTGVCLELQYVDGITLRDRVRGGALELDEVLRHMRAVADALAHAHESGVSHCDLKPSNVMIGRDGHLHVVDFGLARTRDTIARNAAGTPDWMAPEQWLGGALTDRVDSWALGVMTAELLTGAHPLGDDAESRKRAALDPDRVAAFSCPRRDVPARLVDLIGRSLDFVAERRPSALDWRRVLDDAINGRSDLLAEDGPYPGLAAFDERHARFYHGRELELDEFIERLRDTPCLPIIGPSGAGKSSFLHGGVIPRLRARENPTVIAFRPGADPVGALARCVLRATNDPSGAIPLQSVARDEVVALRTNLLMTPTLLAARMATLVKETKSRVLIAVDQLEEAFTQCADASERERFFEMLLAVADEAEDPVRVVFTLRDDFIGGVPHLRSLFVVQRLNNETLRRIVTAPLDRYHYEFDDPSIVDDLIADVGTTQGASLPLLQFACRTLWNGRDSNQRKLRRATYIEMGGVAGALAKHAEQALSEMNDEQRRLARQILLHLVSGTTRRTVPRDQLLEVIGAGSDPVLDRLLSTRLLVQRGGTGGEIATIEIAHESLLRTWDQLARWVDESKEERRLLEELTDTVAMWKRHGAPIADAWKQGDVAAVRRRAQQLQLEFPDSVEAFLAAVDSHHRDRQRRRRRRLTLISILLGIVGAIVFVFVGRYLAREHDIASNTGHMALSFELFDWSDTGTSPATTADYPNLSVEIYGAVDDAAKIDRAHDPIPDKVPSEKPLDASLARATRTAGALPTWDVSAPGGTIFLKVTGRARAGEPDCAPSWTRIQQFPGFANQKDKLTAFTVKVPTCDASKDDMKPVPAGYFIYGGVPTRMVDKDSIADYLSPIVWRDEPAYSIDRTEVSNGRFGPFRAAAPLTEYPPPVYGDDAVHGHDGDPPNPVNAIDYFQARAYCRYLGKELPTEMQWVKAARGGIVVNGDENAYPLRTYPYGDEEKPFCMNQEGLRDGHRWMAESNSFECGKSPYGVLNLAGNVQEWILRSGQADQGRLYALRGGSADSPHERKQTTTLFRNHRDPRRFDYSVGFRCVAAPEASDAQDSTRHVHIQ